MNTQQQLVSTVPLPKELLGESFVDEEELAAKILHVVQEREGADASDTRLKTRKRRRGNEEGPTGTRTPLACSDEPNVSGSEAFERRTL